MASQQADAILEQPVSDVLETTSKELHFTFTDFIFNSNLWFIVQKEKKKKKKVIVKGEEKMC